MSEITAASYFKGGSFTACPKDADAHIALSWSMWKPARKETFFGDLFESPELRRVIHQEQIPKRNHGDSVSIAQRRALTGNGVTGCTTLTGREECPTTDESVVRLGHVRHATCMQQCGCWEQHFNKYVRTRDWALEDLKRWFADYPLSTSVALQLAGYTGANFIAPDGSLRPVIEQYRGFNPIYAPSNHYAVSGGELVPIADNKAGEDSITREDRMSVAVLRRISATLGNSCYGRIRPLTKNAGRYVLFLHPTQVADLKADPEWTDVYVNAAAAGKDNPIFTGALGMFDGIILREACELPNGLHQDGSINANVRRAVLVGENALTLVLSQHNCASKGGKIHRIPFRILYSEADYNYKQYLGIAAIFGVVKNRFNGKDTSVSVISTYADNARYTDADMNRRAIDEVDDFDTVMSTVSHNYGGE